MSTSRQEGGNPGWNEFPELDSESAAPPPLQIVSWPSSPWQHQMAFDFESYRDCSSDYLPTNICSTRSSSDGDGEGLALSPLWKFSDVSYPSVPHPNAPNRFSTYPLSNSVLSLTISKFVREDFKMECEIIAAEDECFASYSFEGGIGEKIREENGSFLKMLRSVIRALRQKLGTITFEEDFDICKIPQAVELRQKVGDCEAQARVLGFGKPIQKLNVIFHVGKQKKRVEDFDKYKMLKVFELLGKLFPNVEMVKELRRDKSKRRCGKTAKSVSLEDLKEVSDRNRNEAAKSLGVNISSLKRRRKNYSIPVWRLGRRIEDERSMSESELKEKQLCVKVPEVAFNQTSLTSNPLYDMVGSNTVPTNLSSCGQQTSLVYDPKPICQSATYCVHAPVSMQLGTPIKQIPEFIQSIPQCSNPHLEQLATTDIQEVKELKRDKSNKRCGKTAKSISVEDLEELSDRNRNEAAKSLGVSVPTLKRICRGHGIPRWPPAKRNEDDRSLSEFELKGKSLCGGVPEVAFNQTSLTSNPLSDMVGPSTIPTSLNSCSQQNSLAFDPTAICQSATYSIHAPVSMQLGSPIEQIPEFIQSDSQCSNLHLEQLAAAHIPPPQPTVQGVESIAVKATFGEDLIKFDLVSSSQMVNLEEEVAKRLKLKQENFKVKYIDEENDWVLIACDVDLKRCIDTMRSLGRTTIRILVQPINH